MSERTTSEVVETLGNDINRCNRELVRAIFAFIEAVTFSVKIDAAIFCMDSKIELSD
jgi:hypothetical protein